MKLKYDKPLFNLAFNFNLRRYNKEVTTILMQRLVKVDGKTRVDKCYPAGFMDVVSIDKTDEHFRLIYDQKGRFVVHRITALEAQVRSWAGHNRDTPARGRALAAVSLGLGLRPGFTAVNDGMQEGRVSWRRAPGAPEPDTRVWGGAEPRASGEAAAGRGSAGCLTRALESLVCHPLHARWTSQTSFLAHTC